jgi:hypothetical protein
MHSRGNKSTALLALLFEIRLLDENWHARLSSSEAYFVYYVQESLEAYAKGIVFLHF